MPLNASPEFIKAMEKYSSARTVQEKIRALQEALTHVPKHKGAEKTRAFLLRRLAELKREAEKKKKASGRSLLVQKEAYMVALFGFGNCGKSYILKELTGSRVEVTDYPYSTAEPVTGIFKVGGGKIQLVEVPSYFDGYSESKVGRTGLAMMRVADAIGMVIDLTYSPRSQVESLLSFLESEDIFPGKKPPSVKVEKRPSGGIEFVGKSFMEGERELFISVLHSYGIHNAVVTFYEKATPEDLSLALDESARFPDIVLIGNKSGFENEFFELPYPKVLFKNNPNEFGEELLKALELIRVYTKPPKGKPAEEPLVLKKGARISDVAEKVLGGKSIKFAKVWGNVRFQGQMVGSDFELSDGDIVELH